MNEVLAIGIDSLDPVLITKYIEYLPNFSKLMSENSKISLTSVFPVDSIPAWSSIYTGWNPAQHGIVKAFDVFDTNLEDILKVDYSIFKGNTFWDHASEAGKKVCSIFPMMTFPPWQTNGIMISKTLNERISLGGSEWIVEHEVKTYPESIAQKYNLPSFTKGISGKHPGPNNLKKWAEDGKQILLNEAEIGLNISVKEDWDLFFIYFSWLDIIQHRLWRYCDENDPTFPGINPYQNIIKEFYQIADKIVGDFIASNPNATTIIFSDHGHSMRPTKVVNVNKILKDEGFLFNSKHKPGKSKYVMEKVKLTLLNIAKKHELDFLLVNLSTKNKFISSMTEKIYTSSSGDEKENRLAHLSTFAGIKSYSHGGIVVEEKNLNHPEDYDTVCNEIILKLSTLIDPKSGVKLFQWICKREDLYEGSKLKDAYPDIVFRLNEEYGTGWNTYSSLIGPAYDHNLASGGHSKKATFLMHNLKNRTILADEMLLVDIAPSILNLLMVEGNFQFNGKSIFGPSNMEK